MQLINILLLSLGLLFSQVVNAELLDYIVAVVNDDVIVNTDLQKKIKETEERLRQQNIRVPATVDLEKQVLENMTMITLQLQLAERTGITVDDNSLNETLRDIAVQNNMNLRTFQENLAKEGSSFVKFRENVKQEMTIKRLQQRQVVNRIEVSEREIDNFLANQVQQGTTSQEYHLLHILIATPEAASPEQIEVKQRNALEILEKIRSGTDFQEIAVTASDGQQALEGGDLGWRKAGEIPSLFLEAVHRMKPGDVEGPFHNASGFHLVKLADKRNNEKLMVNQTKARHILIKTSELVSDSEAKDRLEELKLRIESGEDFATLARANSEDAGSAAEGGSLGWISSGDLVPEFEEVMNPLPENQLSDPFKSRYGWHLIQVLERRQHDDTEKSVRLKAAQQIRQRKVEEELQTWLRQLHDEAYIEYLKK